MCYAMTAFIDEKLGSKYVETRTMEFAKSFEETSPSTPIFFILSPGVNPLKDVEALGHILGYTADSGNFHNVSLGKNKLREHNKKFTNFSKIQRKLTILFVWKYSRTRARSGRWNCNGKRSSAWPLGCLAEYPLDKEVVANAWKENGLLCGKFTWKLSRVRERWTSCNSSCPYYSTRNFRIVH